MPILRPADDLCRRLLTVGLPEVKHNRRTLRSVVHRSTGVPPNEHVSADELARKILDLHEDGRLNLQDSDRF
jgi:hypothetical protein